MFVSLEDDLDSIFADIVLFGDFVDIGESALSKLVADAVLLVVLLSSDGGAHFV